MNDNDLNKIRLPLAELRIQIVAMMKEGVTEVTLGDYLLMLRTIYRKSKDEEQEIGGG